MDGVRVRVLIVEDNQIFADTLRLLLDRADGIEVVGIAGDGGEAIDLALTMDAQVVLMDIGLPGASGFEAIRRLLAIKPSARVIALTGQTADEARPAAVAAGAVDFLTKGGIHEHVRDAIFRAMAGMDGVPDSEEPAQGAELL